MRKFILIFSLLTLAINLCLFSQTEKGNWLLGFGASTNFTYSQTSAYSYNLALYPNSGYFVSDNLALGLSIPLSLTYSGSLNTSYGFTPFINYYFGKHEKTKNFITGDAGILGASHSEGSENSLKIGFGYGIVYFLNPSIGIQTYIKEDYMQLLNSSASVSITGIYFGLQIFFKRTDK